MVKLRVVEDTQGPLKVCATNVCAEDIVRFPRDKIVMIKEIVTCQR